ncbi:MAG: YdcH family protein [Alphaproteobacteria bacterium]|nr:YdcH family protein [Alphaproteobacteria bacterium]
MTGDERIESLKVKHAKLEHLIDQEAHRPMPDDAQIAKLKREKLRLKDEIARRTLPH